MGKIVTMISSFMAIAIVALPAGFISTGLMEELNENKEATLNKKGDGCMTCEELKALEKTCKKLDIFRILAAPVLAIVLLLIVLIIFAIKQENGLATVLAVLLCGTWVPFAAYGIINAIYKKKKTILFNAVEQNILKSLGISSWKYTNRNDDQIELNSSRAVEGYDEIRYFKENPGKLAYAISLITQKKEYKNRLVRFLNDNEYQSLKIYEVFKNQIENNLLNTDYYYLVVHYISPAGRKENGKLIYITESRLRYLEEEKSLLMTKGEYNKYLRDQATKKLEEKKHQYYQRVNEIIDFANENKDSLINKNDADEMDKLIAELFDRTVNSIKKVKSYDSEEWDFIYKVISGTDESVRKITDKNNQILNYYSSEDFATIKLTCDTLMNTQREFNEYIDEKVRSISELFGTSIVRNETTNEDEFNYIHPYKKSITPFTAEVSASVFASAENSPLDYIIKCFYPLKSRYPEQIQKLQLLIEELETLKEARIIIENYKKDIHQYLENVPSFIMENDKDGFYSRLGFATINENTLIVEYKFVYTSNGGRAQRSFTVPMTEDTIVKLIDMLESKLTISAFTREQRALMTTSLRQKIKERDNYTCQSCGNSTYIEPNLLLEIDHIIPVSKGGYTREDNLQTYCWKCNRSKGNKLL